MSIEKIVRPFQLGDVFTARTLPPVQLSVTIPDSVTISWGGGNSGNYTQFQVSGLAGGKVNYTEKDRVTKKVRITNPQDSSQYVDVERIVKLRLANDQGNEIHFNLGE